MPKRKRNRTPTAANMFLNFAASAPLTSANNFQAVASEVPDYEHVGSIFANIKRMKQGKIIYVKSADDYIAQIGWDDDDAIPIIIPQIMRMHSLDIVLVGSVPHTKPELMNSIVERQRKKHKDSNRWYSQPTFIDVAPIKDSEEYKVLKEKYGKD